MKLIILPAILGGMLLTLLLLRVTHGNYKELGEISAYTVGTNAIVGVIAYFIFRGGPQTDSIAKIALVLGYLVGIIGGCYFYYS